MRAELEKKVRQAIKLIQSTCGNRGEVEVAYSGGKDSDVILQLVKESGIQYRAVYKNTTIDPPGTIRHVKEVGGVILRPKFTFFELIARNGFPHHFRRFCCRFLKEYRVGDTAIIGVRASESVMRAKRYKEPTECRAFSKKEGDKTYQVMPILYWTDEDVAEFIADRGIKCHPMYYDEDGVFQVGRRLGCMGCPMMSRRQRVEWFKKNPKMLRAYVRAGLKYNFKKYNAYEVMACDLLYDKFWQFKEANKPNLFGERIDWKAELERIFKIDLTI